MPEPIPPLHELDAEIMETVWAREETTVREVMERLNARAAKPRAYTTYLTIMSRLVGKGLLLRRREGKTDVFRAAHTREEYADLRAQAEVDSLVDQFGDVALGHFARQIARLDPERRRALQRLARRE
jgi:predicted transcriptional regulator